MSVVEHLSTGSSNPPLSSGKLRLYSMRFCPYAQRVHLILNAKAVPHDVVYINLITKPEWYTKMIPTGKVPALVVKDTDLYESLIISDYLNEAYSTVPLYSNDPIKKAKDRILIESFGSVSGAMYKIYFTPNQEQKLLEDLVTAINPYEKEITVRGTKYFGGSSPGMVDYMIWPWVERFDVLPLVTEPIFKVPEEKFPNLMKWKSLMIEDKAVKAHYLNPEQHAHHLKMRKAGTPDYVII